MSVIKRRICDGCHVHIEDDEKWACMRIEHKPAGRSTDLYDGPGEWDLCLKCETKLLKFMCSLIKED